MSWKSDLTTARARLVALEAAELKIACGEQVSEVSYNGGSTKFAKGATLAEVRFLIAETLQVIQILSGACRTGGVIAPYF